MNKLRGFFVGVALAAVAGAFAVSGGGFPSMPTFAKVTIGAPTSAVGAGNVGINATSGAPAYVLLNGATNEFFLCEHITSSCITGDAVNDIGIRAQNGALNFSANGGTSTAMKIAGTGDVTINTPTSGTALTVSGFSTQASLVVQATSTTAGTIELYDTTNSAFRGYLGAGGTCTGQAIADFCIAPGIGGVLQLGTGGGAAVVGPVAATTTGSFTGTWAGCTTAPTQTILYSITGKVATLTIPNQTCTSNSTSFSITGAPSAIDQGHSFGFPLTVMDNSAIGVGTATVVGSSIIFLKAGVVGGFTASGTKGISDGSGGIQVTYTLN